MSALLDLSVEIQQWRDKINSLAMDKQCHHDFVRELDKIIAQFDKNGDVTAYSNMMQVRELRNRFVFQGLNKK